MNPTTDGPFDPRRRVLPIPGRVRDGRGEGCPRQSGRTTRYASDAGCVPVRKYITSASGTRTSWLGLIAVSSLHAAGHAMKPWNGPSVVPGPAKGNGNDPPGKTPRGSGKADHRRQHPARTPVRRSRRKSSGLAVADSYAREVIAGTASRRVQALAARYLEERRAGSGVVWDGDRLDRLLAWGRDNLRTARGAMEWHPWSTWAMALLVARRGGDGLPLTRELVLQVPRGCGKTQIAAAVAGWTLDEATKDGRTGCEIIVLATMLDKAKETAVRLAAVPAVRSEEWKCVGLTASMNRAAVVTSPAGFIKCAASTPQNADGITPSLVVLDEAARMDETFNRAMSSMMKVPWCQALIVTTPDVDQYANPYGSLVREVEDALDNGKPLPPGTIAIMHQADPGDDPTDPAVWAKANPGLGTTVSAAEYDRRKWWATSGSPKQREEWYTQYLSTFVNDLSAAIPIEYYDSCVEDWNLEQIRGLPAMVGIDFSVGGWEGVQCDLTSLHLAAWDGVRLWARGWHWWAGVNIEENEQRTRMPLREWVQSGRLMVAGPTINIDAVRDVVASIANVVQLRYVVCDPAAGMASRVQAWESSMGWQVSRAPQTVVYMGSAWAVWQDMVRAKRIRFADDPIMRAAILSSKTETGPTGLVMVRKLKDRANNDPLIAAMMTVKAMHDREMLVESMYSGPNIQF